MKTFILDEEALRKGWGGKNQYWFSPEKYEVVENTVAAHHDFPEGMDSLEYAASKGYIPYFRVERLQLAKAYISAVGSEKLKGIFSKFSDEEYIETFWKYYHAYPHLAEGYEEFQNVYIIERAVDWCFDNKINFEIPK